MLKLILDVQAPIESIIQCCYVTYTTVHIYSQKIALKKLSQPKSDKLTKTSFTSDVCKKMVKTTK